MPTSKLLLLSFHSFHLSYLPTNPYQLIQQQDNSLKNNNSKKKEQCTILYLQRIIWNVTVVSAAVPRDRALG